MSEQITFNLTDIIQLIRRWLKTIVLFVVLATGLTAGLSFLLPKTYKATVTMVPANPAMTDKAYIFNQNIKDLYSDLGGGNDLERLYATSGLDTFYAQIVDSFQLVDYYKIKTSPASKARFFAVERIHKLTRVSKSESGSLQIEVWDKDAVRASNMANAMVVLIQRMNNDVLHRINRLMYGKLKEAYTLTEKNYLQLRDSLSGAAPGSAKAELLEGRKKVAVDQLQEYQKLVSQFEFILNSNPPSLIVIENATPPQMPDKPRKTQITIYAFLLSSLFAVLMALVLERLRRKK